MPTFFVPPIVAPQLATKIKNELGSAERLKKLDEDYEVFKKLKKGTDLPANARTAVLDLVMSRYCAIDNLQQARDQNGNQGQDYKKLLMQWKGRQKLNTGMLGFVPILERAAFDICIHYWVKYIEKAVGCGFGCIQIDEYISSFEILVPEALSRGWGVSFARAFFDAFPF